MIAVVCSVNGRCLPVLQASLENYAPQWTVIVSVPPGIYCDKNRINNTAKNFGDAYNAALDAAFALSDDDAAIMLNDDCVLTPATAEVLMADVSRLKIAGEKIGLVATRADWIRRPQSVRYPAYPEDRFGTPEMLKWSSESKVFEVPVVAPVCAYVSREAFQTCRIPPIDWFSDDVWSRDLGKQGFKHFVSRAYVHHVGAQHTGLDAERLTNAAKPWIKANRPDYYAEYFPHD